MNTLPYLLVLSLLLTIASGCQPDVESETTSSSGSNEIRQATAQPQFAPYDTLRLQHERFAGHPLLFYLRHPQVPQVAKDLYLRRVRPTDDAATLALMDSIFTNNIATQSFYFLTLTRTMPQADGAYSEPLGIMAREFVEKQPARFTAYFLVESLLTKDDFNNWAEHVAMELDISNEGREASARAAWAAAQLSNCKNCNAAERNRLREFTKLVSIWQP